MAAFQTAEFLEETSQKRALALIRRHNDIQLCLSSTGYSQDGCILYSIGTYIIHLNIQISHSIGPEPKFSTLQISHDYYFFQPNLDLITLVAIELLITDQESERGRTLDLFPVVATDLFMLYVRPLISFSFPKV